MKKRHELPLMARLNFNIDHERLLKEFYEYGYDDWSIYNGLKKGSASDVGLYVRNILLSYFLAEGESTDEGGEAYKMLCLTEYNSELKSDPDKIKSMDPGKLEKISNPNHPLYVPEADEKLYDKRNEYCKGYISEVMDMIEEKVGHVARTRFAVLKAGEKIKPHRDINTDKAIRIHIPLITDPRVTIGVKGKKRIIEEHMPADGGVWFLNQGYEHWVNNNSDVDRVHLVFVVVGQDNVLESDVTYWDDNLYANAS